MSTSDPTPTAPGDPISPTPAVDVEASDETELDPKVAAAKALIKKKPALVAAGSLDSAATSPESPPPAADDEEPATDAADAAAVTAPAPAEDSVAEPLAPSVASGEEVRDVLDKNTVGASDDLQTPPAVAGEFSVGQEPTGLSVPCSLFVCFVARILFYL